MKVLVAYASAHGSTGEVAEFIGREFTAKGLTVTTVNVNDVQMLGEYDAFVLGTAIHSGSWLPEMARFMIHWEERLAQKPVYFWVNCVRIMEQYGREHVMEYYMRHDILHRIGAHNVAIFAGKLDLKAVDWNERWTLAARYDGATWPNGFDGDFRDWDKIRAWANHVANELSGANAAS
jgi:menaquinone-dependent protoporphyrinogen oxidase